MDPSVSPPTIARRIGIACLLALTVAYYFWTLVTAIAGAPRIHGNESDHFNLLSRGFRKGHLYLDHEVPAALLQATNPYDPALRSTVSVLHDASYFQGKYYIYFGPGPVVTLLLPFRYLTGRDLPLPYAVWLFSSAGYLALAASFLFIQRRYFPRASGWTVSAGLIALGGASMTVALLRRANIWEMSAAAGFAFFSVSLLCLVRALHATRPDRWAAVGGLALGLAVASRPTYVLCSVLFALPWIFQRRDGQAKSGYRWSVVLSAALGCTIPVLGLMAYNYARFGNAFEFGQKFQLSLIIEGDARHFSLSYIPFNFRIYFLSMLQWLPSFPFVGGISLPPIPPGHAGHEFTFGVLSNLPFSFFGLAALASLAPWPPFREFPLGLRLTFGVVAGAAALNAAVMLCYFGSCIRYMIEFTPYVMLLAAFGLLALEGTLRTRFSALLLRGGALLLAGFSAFSAAASVVKTYELIEGNPPAGYRPIARVLNVPTYALKRLRWSDYGPVEVAVTLSNDRTPRREPILSVHRSGRQTAVVLVEYLPEQMVRFGYRDPDMIEPVFSMALGAAPAARHKLRLSIGSTYAEYNGRKARLRAEFDGVPFWDLAIVSFDAYPGKITTGAEAAANPGDARFSGTIHSVNRIDMPELAPMRFAGIRARITVKPEMAGQAYPLLTTGKTKAGDMFFFRVHADRKISVGYDHWGAPLITSPEFPVAVGEARILEFWLPAVAPPGSVPRLIVKLDGATILERDAPAFSVEPGAFFLGRNPIGGSHCQAMVINTIFEDVRLPYPN